MPAMIEIGDDEFQFAAPRNNPQRIINSVHYANVIIVCMSAFLVTSSTVASRVNKE